MGLIENHEILLRQLKGRFSPKKFDATKKLTDEQWNTLEQALILTPSSYGLQPWRFIVVTDQALKEKLKLVSYYQSQVSDCSHYVVMCIKEKMDEEWVQRYVDRMVKVRGVTPESLARMKQVILGDVVTGNRSKNAIGWATNQIYIALGQLVTAAAIIGVDSCPMEGFQPDKYDEILDLTKDGFKSSICCAIGYRHPEDPLGLHKKVRFEPNEVIVRK